MQRSTMHYIMSYLAETYQLYTVFPGSVLCGTVTLRVQWGFLRVHCSRLVVQLTERVESFSGGFMAQT